MYCNVASKLCKLNWLSICKLCTFSHKIAINLCLSHSFRNYCTIILSFVLCLFDYLFVFFSFFFVVVVVIVVRFFFDQLMPFSKGRKIFQFQLNGYMVSDSTQTHAHKPTDRIPSKLNDIIAWWSTLKRERERLKEVVIMCTNHFSSVFKNCLPVVNFNTSHSGWLLHSHFTRLTWEGEYASKSIDMRYRKILFANATRPLHTGATYRLNQWILMRQWPV